MKQIALDQAVSYLQDWLPFRYKNETIPGISIAVVHKNNVIFNEAYGYANIESEQLLKTDDLFRVASHSKTFAATITLKLQEQGVLRIDDTVVTYLDWLNEHKDERWKTVTIRQLLSHGAGIIRDGKDTDYWQLQRDFPDAQQLQKEILEDDLVIENNIKLKYSNYGYGVLGMVLESATGQSYEELFNTYIVQPLQLANLLPDASIKSVATGYGRKEALIGKRQSLADSPTGALQPATGVCATASELALFFSTFLKDNNTLLTEASKKEMRRLQFQAKLPEYSPPQEYALGFILEKQNGRALYGHGGGFPGHTTKTIVDPELDLTISVLTNAIDASAVDIARGIDGIFGYFSKNATAQIDPTLADLQGRYVSLWGITDIVAMGDKLASTYPDAWYPLSYFDTLEHVEGATFKITDTDSYGSDGELVTFEKDGSTVTLMRYAGSTMWPLKEWNKRLE